MSDAAAHPATSAPRLQLWSEFVLLFVGVPILMAIYFEDIQRNRMLFPTVLGLAGLGEGDWTPQYSYRLRPGKLEDGGANVLG